MIQSLLRGPSCLRDFSVYVVVVAAVISPGSSPPPTSPPSPPPSALRSPAAPSHAPSQYPLSAAACRSRCFIIRHPARPHLRVFPIIVHLIADAASSKCRAKSVSTVPWPAKNPPPSPHPPINPTTSFAPFLSLRRQPQWQPHQSSPSPPPDCSRSIPPSTSAPDPASSRLARVRHIWRNLPALRIFCKANLHPQFISPLRQHGIIPYHRPASRRCRSPPAAPALPVSAARNSAPVKSPSTNPNREITAFIFKLSSGLSGTG